MVHSVTDDEIERVREVLKSARETILDLKNARWSEAEGSDEAWVADIDAAILAMDRRAEVVDKAAEYYANDLEQCALFVDSFPLKKAMTDAAAYLRYCASPPAPPSPGAMK